MWSRPRLPVRADVDGSIIVRRSGGGDSGALHPANKGSRQFSAALGREIDRAALPNVVEMLAQEGRHGTLAAIAQLQEEVVVGIELRGGGQLREHAVERDAVHVDPTVLAGF